jgi:hypothetical protein
LNGDLNSIAPDNPPLPQTEHVWEAALAYLARGYKVIPVPYREKGANLPGWQKLAITEAELDHYFPPDSDSNIGLLLGEPSSGLVDVDLDCKEAEALADSFLPHTSMVHGRPGHSRTHRWYQVKNPPAKATTGFKDPKGCSLVELRSTGGQTVVPPSVHPEGGHYTWDSTGKPAEVPLDKLLCSVRRLAAAALLAQHWPGEGSRQDAAMALGGALGRAGWDEDEAAEFVELVAEAGEDEESSKRADAARCSARKAQDGAKVTAWTTLAKIMDKDAVQKAKDWLAWEGRHAGRAKPDQPPKESARLVKLAEGSIEELFHDTLGNPYAAVRVQSHREVLRVDSPDFRRWLAQQANRVDQAIPGRSALDEAADMFLGRAQYLGPEREVFLRVGEAGGKLYLDLGTPDWSAVEIDNCGWRIVPWSPVNFRRTKGMLPLPMPQAGGDLRELQQVLNLGDEDNWSLVVGWLLGALLPSGPYPVLVLHGEQGSAKSTTVRALRSLIDPHVTLLRSAPRDEQNLFVAAQNNWVVCWDNLSHLRAWQSDALCRLATGGGFATRKLYSNDEEVQIQVARPVILNGIASEMVSQPDLLNRVLMVELPVITDTGRRAEKDVKGELELLRPSLLGALLDTIVVGLRNRDTVHLDRLPRMADFVRWVEACGPALGWQLGEYRTLFEQSQGRVDSQALSLWPVYPALCRLLVAKAKVLETTVGGLLKLLNKMRNDGEEAWDTDWPTSARKLSAELRRYTPALRRVGIELEWLSRDSKGRQIRIITPPRAGSVAGRVVSVSA